MSTYRIQHVKIKIYQQYLKILEGSAKNVDYLKTNCQKRQELLIIL